MVLYFSNRFSSSIRKDITQRTRHVESTSIPLGYYVDTSKTKYRQISTSFPRIFSMYSRWSKNPRCFHVLFQRNFDGRKTHVVFTYFFRCNLIVEKSTLFPPTFFDVISLVEKSTLFSLTFFNIILMVQKSMLFTNTFFGEILTGRNSTSFLVKLEANESIWQGFPLKNWLLQDFSP